MPPANDNWVSATVITGISGSTTGTNVGATLEVGEPGVDTPADGVTGAASVWWAWTAPGNGTVSIDTFGSRIGTDTLDTVLDVWTGSAVNALTAIANDDDTLGHDPTNPTTGGTTSQVSFTAVSGTTYYIRVNGYDNTQQGNIDLAWSLVVSAPVLAVTKTHSGTPVQGQHGVAYTITVSNTGTAATSGTVTVIDSLPAGLTATAFTGTGWTCVLGTLTATRSDALAAGASYPALTLTVDVARNARTPQVNSVNASGGGGGSASATDSTTITIRNWTAIWTSPDGVAWTDQISPYDAEAGIGGGAAPTGLAWDANNSLWVVASVQDPGNGIVICTSPDGATWTPRSSPADTVQHGRRGIGVSTTLGLTVVAGNYNSGSANTVMVVTSAADTTWTERDPPIPASLAVSMFDASAICWTGTSFVAVGEGNGSTALVVWVLVSTDGITWTYGGNNEILIADCVATDGSRVVAGGVAGGSSVVAILTSDDDGATWTRRTSAFDAGPGEAHAVAWNGALWVAVGQGSSGTVPIICTSPDGATWTSRTVPSGINALSGVTWSSALTLWVATAATLNPTDKAIVTSPDGVTWTAHSTVWDGQHPNSVAWSPTLAEFVAVGVVAAPPFPPLTTMRWRTGAVVIC